MYKLTAKHIVALKVLLHAGNLVAFLLLTQQTLSGQYGAEPLDAITHFTGIAALNLLLICLSISPLAKIAKQGQLLKCRRLAGLYCFYWASLHMLTFVWLNLDFDLALFGQELISRPYLTLGMISWLILLLLALTSTHNIQRKMGKNWQPLHNWVYLALILAPIHFLWSVKSGLVEPYLYLAIALFLLLIRKQKLVTILIKTKGLLRM